MKYQVVYRKTGPAEIHAPGCREFGWEDYEADIVVNADHGYGAAWEAWNHEEDAERLMLEATAFYPCLRAGYVAGPARPKQRRPTRRNVPFNVDDLEGEVIEACYGRIIRWVNSISGEEEEARLFPAGPRSHMIRGSVILTEPHRHTNIKVSSAGRRVLQFIDARGTGFRGVALDAIVSVK